MEDYIAAFYENVCIYLQMESETLNFVQYLGVAFVSTCFYIIWVCESVEIIKIKKYIHLYLMFFTFKLAKQKMTSKISFFLFVLLHINTHFRFGL